MANDLVFQSDAAALGFCAKGVRYFCKMNGIVYLDFVKKGIPESQLLNTGDSMAQAVVEQARKRRM